MWCNRISDVSGVMDTGSIPGLLNWGKDCMLQQPRLGSDPWPRNSICLVVARKEK